MASSGSDPPERKQLQISKHSRKIKKQPLPPTAAIAHPPIIEHEREPPSAANTRPPIIKHERESRTIHIKACDFQDLIDRLTGQTPPSSPSTDSDHDHDPSSSHHPASFPSPLRPLEELSIYDYDWEGPAYPFHIIPPANFNNLPLPSPNFNNLPPSSSNFNNLHFPSSNFNNVPLPSPNFNNLRPSSSNFNMRPPRPLYYPPKFPDPFN